MDANSRRLEPGATVVGSDGSKVGTISAVREDHLVVEHGTLSKHDLYIPIDALARTDDGSVALNVPAGKVDSQGWRYPPTASYEHATPAYPEVPDTTMIQAAGYSAGTLSAPEAQGFVRDVDGDDEALANRAIDPQASEALDDED